MSSINGQDEERDGTATSALAELEHGTYDRQRFLRLVGGVGALGAASAFLAGCGDDSESNRGGSNGSDAESSSDEKSATTTSEDEQEGTSSSSSNSPSDLEIVNYALTLEYLEADFYTQVAESGLFKGKELDLIKVLRDHEQQHVDALKATAQQLGTPATRPKTSFPLESRETVLDLAATVENVGAAAYLGQAANIQSEDILNAALSIHTVEARHAAALNRLVGKDPTPDGAFAMPMTMEAVLEAVQPFIQS